MNRIYVKNIFMILWAVTVLIAVPSGAFAAAPLPPFTPPGPGSANPSLQANGIQVPDVFGSTPNWQFSPPLRKFVDTLAPLGCDAGTNTIGQCIPVAVPDIATFPGSDYYEIELNRYTEKMHTDLPPTTLQGYRQVNGPAGPNRQQHYLGPIIVAKKDRPVRIKFMNKLPKESDAPFFLPVDTTVMGSGMGPLSADGQSACDPVVDPRNPDPARRNLNPTCASYTKNRAELHLHGGLSPWISDGTPHQWVAPFGEDTPYKKADNVQYVPDMWFKSDGTVITDPPCAGQATCPIGSNNPGDGAVTYYYTNQQSARLMFYHDHSYGITRLNVYAGEAAGYLIRDDKEQQLIDSGVIPGTKTDGTVSMGGEIPLIIQDKSFVDASMIPTLDPTWVWGTGAKSTKWLDAAGAPIGDACPDGAQTCATPGARKMITATPQTGDLWWPHVYMPAENPVDLGGVNPLGRWVYGMYFWPPTTGIKFLPVDNPYYDCGPDGLCDSPWEPPKMPATPNPSWVAEAFLDTQTVNGTVFPTVTVDPKPYRFRILNASHDRFLNLQLYKADGSVDANAVNPICGGLCAQNTEVKMVPAIAQAGWTDEWIAAADNREGGVPDPATAGPPWIQIGNEGGFLPAPVVINNKPISFVMDPTLFNVGNVNDGTVILGPAERADAILDFSAYGGQTFILYNDAPAAFPAFVPNNDYYTGAPDLRDTGGHPGPKAGTGPNTRTIMQIKVNSGSGPQFELTRLQDTFKAGVFKDSQHEVIVGQSAYDSAYNTTFPSSEPTWGLAKISDQSLSFETVTPTGAKELVTNYPMQPKALHDEMGAVWDEYGRMSAKLGVELPNTNNINQIFVMQNYQDKPTEHLQDGKVQLWRLTHNGVDTHPLHFHLFDVQVVNRVGWDGFIRLPWPNELGWKETVRVSPLEDTIVALRPKAPKVPFELKDSVRYLQPANPKSTDNLPGSLDGFMNLNTLTGQPLTTPQDNVLYNFGAEYVWHCHILSHEEQDMMRSMVFRVATAKPGDPYGLSITANPQRNELAWTDSSYQITSPPYNSTLGFTVERANGDVTSTCATDAAFASVGKITMLSGASQTFVDSTAVPGRQYTYRVTGYNSFVDNGPFPVVWHEGPADPLATSAPICEEVTTSTAPSWATSVILDAYLASPQVAPVKFYAQAAGGSGQYQYRFLLDGQVVQDYSTIRFWSIPASALPGDHVVSVDVRTDTSSPVPDTSASMNYTILAAPNSVVLTFVAGTGGSLSGQAAQSVAIGANAATVTALPDATSGYQFVNWTDSLNNVVGTAAALTITNVAAAETYTANFAKPSFTAIFVADANGTIAGTTPQTVLWGASTAPVTAQANDPAAYVFVNWTIAASGVVYSTSNPLTIVDVRDNLALQANFALRTYNVDFITGAGGSIVPADQLHQAVSHGGSTTTVTAAPNLYYSFVNWTENGTPIGTAAALQLTTVTAPHAVTANFVRNTVSVTTTAGPNGQITATNGAVPAGTDYTVTVSPYPTYRILQVLVDGVEVPLPADPTVPFDVPFTTIAANHTVDATFVIATVNVYTGSGVTGPTVVDYGSTPSYTFAAPAGYTISDVVINGVSQGPIISYTYPAPVTTSQSIYVVFAVKSFTVTLDRCMSGPTTVGYGDMPTYLFNSTGFSVTATLNGTPITTNGNLYTFANGITANQIFKTEYTVNPVGTSSPVVIMRNNSMVGFSSLQAAYDAAVSGETILLKGGTLTGGLIANRAITVNVRGGYEATYSVNCGLTRMKSQILVRQGTVRLDRSTIAY